MVQFLRMALYFLTTLIPVTKAVHFTNADWDLSDNTTFTFNWAYDSEDERDPDKYYISIWLPLGSDLWPWSGNWSHLVYNGERLQLSDEHVTVLTFPMLEKALTTRM